MSFRSLALTATALVTAAGGLTCVAGATTPSDAPVIAVVDSGVRPTHQEFDYQGASSTTDQFVGWWDFTGERKGSVVLPAAGQSWDTAVADPYDTNGHGTLTAAMAAGLNVEPTATHSAAPGAKLAIARVATADGTIQGDVAAAVRWATDTVHADVINISIANAVPEPGSVFVDALAAISYARSKGVLVVVANGNGLGNALVPGMPGWSAGAYAGSGSVLAVGASEDIYKYLVSTDPEVVAVFTATGPSSSRDTGYRSEGGTSFASPYVAGFAASLIEAARTAGTPLPVDRLETLIKYSATDDPSTPPTFEGYGRISQAELAAARAHAAAGTLPTPATDANGQVNQFYVDTLNPFERTVWDFPSS